MAEGKHQSRRARRSGTAGSTAKSSPGSVPMRGLQRAAGNSAVAGMIEQLRASEQPGAAGPVAFQHPVFERQADDVAGQAEQHAAAPDTRSTLRSAPLAPEHAADLQALTGKDVGRVRLHTDAAAQTAAEDLGAHAFTSGTDIHFGPGEYDPGSPQGFGLLAHEVTHAVQHPAGKDAEGRPLVHAKLKGMRRAMEDLGGGKSKSLRKKALGSNWNELLSELGSYEKLEDAYAAAVGSNAPEKKVAALRAKLLKSLLSLEKVALKWQQANDQESAEQIKAEVLANVNEDADEDTRTKAPRRQAVALFLTRVRVDRVQLERGEDPTTVGLDDSSLSWGKDDAVGGGMNRLDQVAYASEDGEILEGYFKADKGFSAAMAGHDKGVGIAQHDANYAGRSVAMYRLDKLLQGGVIARTEFAVHTSRDRKAKTRTPGESNLTESTTKFGFVTEKAKGESMGDIAREGKLVRSHEGRDDPGETVAADDPVLQSCMNKLQILDAIAGQLDRHAGNYFVQRDPETGKVLGVTGIDNDMSFGANMQTPDDSKGAHNYLAMPELVDEEFGRRLLQITEKDIRDTLVGLLSDAEIDATVSRFNIVRDVVKNLEEKDQLTKDWGKDTLDEQLDASRGFTEGRRHAKETSMVGREMSGALGAVFFDAKALMAAAKLQFKDRELVLDELRKLVVAQELDLDEVLDLTERILADIAKYVDKRGEDAYPELGAEWVGIYVEGAHRRL